MLLKGEKNEKLKVFLNVESLLFLSHHHRQTPLFRLNKTCKLINYETFMSFVFFVSKNYFATVNMKSEDRRRTCWRNELVYFQLWFMNE